MGFEDDLERGSSKTLPSKNPKMTLQKAVELGEYDPDYLSIFPEWHTLTRHLQFQFVRQGLENRRRILRVQWAEINNILDFRLKPNLKIALKNLEKQLKALYKDEERLYLEYSD
jgi:hypothetical protein